MLHKASHHPSIVQNSAAEKQLDLCTFHCCTTLQNISHCTKRGRFPRVFGDEFGDKFGEKFGDSLNLVKTLVTNLVTKLVNHQIW